jgi:hypothetical protein
MVLISNAVYRGIFVPFPTNGLMKAKITFKTLCLALLYV